LSADRSERSIANYSDRVESLAKGGERDIRREQSILRDKINRLNSRISSTEENMSRFTGKGAQSIIEQAEKTIKGYQREIEEIKAKLKLLREAVAEQSS
jgi:valyl-tRNA synthetase